MSTPPVRAPEGATLSDTLTTMAKHAHRQLWLPLIGISALAGGFAYGRVTGGHHSVDLMKGALYVVGASALLAYCISLGVRLRRMDHWEREGRCRTCGYDRRGLTMTDLCPECGRTGIQ